MSWASTFITATEANATRLAWRVDVVVSTSGIGDAWSVASHEDGDADEVRIEDGSVRLSSSSLDPRGWRTTFGGFSFTLLGSIADFVANVSRGSIVTLSLGIDDADPTNMEIVAIGEVRNIRLVRKGAWEVECIDGLGMLSQRRDLNQGQGFLFFDLPRNSTVDGTAYAPGDTTLKVLSTSPFKLETGGTGAVRVTPTTGDPFILHFTGIAAGPARLTGVSAAGQYGTTAAAAAIGQLVEALALIEGSPGEIFTKILTSTGAGTNGPNDTLPASWGLAIDSALVDRVALAALDSGPLAPSSGNFTVTLIADAEIEDGLSWFVGWMSQIGMFPVIAQGLISAGVAQDTATASAAFTLEDDEIIELLAHEFWDEGHDPEYQFVRVRTATSVDAGTGNPSATLPTAMGLVYDASGIVWSNEGNVQQNIIGRTEESAKRVPERLELRVQTLRCMAIAVGDVGELTYTGTLRRNGALGWTAAPCIVTAITPEPNTNTVVVTLLVYPATEDMYD